MTNFGCVINNLKMIWLVYLLRNKIKFDFDFPFFLFSTWHCRVAIQFEYCFSIIGLYIDIYGYGMLSMGFWLLSKRIVYMIYCCSSKESLYWKENMIYIGYKIDTDWTGVKMLYDNKLLKISIYLSVKN
jgi:hypothetical protein